MPMISQVKTRTVSDPDEAGRRIDNLLISILKKVPRGLIYRLIRQGQVRINGCRVKQDYRLQVGDQIRIPPIRSREDSPIKIADNFLENLERSIIFEDDNLICFNKPEGVAVHGGSSLRYGLIEGIRVSRSSTKFELAHRIDRETSGCLLVCKNRKTLIAVQSEFKNRNVRKVYEFYSVGNWNSRNKSVHQKLKRYKTAWGERRVKIDVLGQNARTDFRVLDKAPHATRVEAVLHTGRTHQIRVHSKHCGNPIIGDRKYGNLEGNCQRLCLHATRLSLEIEGLKYKFDAPKSKELEDIWGKLILGARLD